MIRLICPVCVDKARRRMENCRALKKIFWLGPIIMKLRLLRFVALLLLLLLLSVVVRQANAHANLLQSLPKANATLDRAPVQIELFFSEALEPSFSTVEVLDGNGNRVDNNDAQLVPAGPTHMTASLRSLPDGIYTVSWRALSAVDSHITAGAFPFAVGDVDAAALEAAAQASRQIKVSPGEVIARWLTYLSAMTVVGGALFILAVWQPARESSGVGKELRPPWRGLSTIALFVLIAANLFWLLIQAGQASGGEIALPWDAAVVQVLFNTRFGVLWLARLVLALILIWLVRQPQTRRKRWITLFAGSLLLLTISLGSHAAAQPQPVLPVLADWVHLAAASVWVGGLVHFIVSLYAIRSLEGPDRPTNVGDNVRWGLTAVLIPRFSALALVSVTLLALTGVYATVLHVGSFEALSGTAYGRTLLVKLIIIVPMLLLGAGNLLITSPKMRRAAADDGNVGGPTLVGRFRRLVTSEVALGAAVLFSVGVLTTLPPARVATELPMLGGTQEVDGANEVALEIALEVTPGRPGLNTFLVTITRDGQPLDGVKEVSLQFTPATAEVPPSTAQLTGTGSGQYSINGGFLALPDDWQVQVAVRREDAFDSFANFDLEVGVAAGSATTAQQGLGLAFPWYRVSAILLLLASVAYWLASSSLVRTQRQFLFFGRLPAVLLAGLGLLVFINPPGEQATTLVNPIPPNADSVAAGKVLYEVNCMPCHGQSGAGDGPVGITLNPPPADLTQHTLPGVHPDGRLYNWITDGLPGSVMSAFKDQITDEERWHVVNYIRTLALP